MAGAVCSKCDVGWVIHSHDKHCGYCGCEIFGFSVRWEKEPLVYEDDGANIHDLTILVENTGAYPITFHPIQTTRDSTILFPQPNDSPFEVKAGQCHAVPIQIKSEKLAQNPKTFIVRAQNAPSKLESEKRLPLLKALPHPEFKLTPNPVVVRHRRGTAQVTVNLRFEVLRSQFSIKFIRCSSQWIKAIRCPSGLYEEGKAARNFSLDVDCNQLNDELNVGTLHFELVDFSQPIEKRIHIRREIVPEPPKLFVPPTSLDITQGRRKTHTLTLQNRGERTLIIENIVFNDPSNILQPLNLDFPISINSGEHQDIEMQVSADNIEPGTYPINFTINSNCENEPAYKDILSVNVKKLEEYPHYLAIDFGTTNSCCAYLDLDTFEPKLIPLDSEANPPEIMPSTIIYYSQPKNEKAYKVGYGAETDRTSIIDGPYYISSVKRWLGYRWHRKFPNNQDLQPPKVVSHILKHIINEAEDYLDRQNIPSKITKCVVTHPTMFLQKQRDDLAHVLKKMGITKYHFIDEASAASIGYIGHHLEKYKTLPNNYRMLVYDFGGGTIDIALSQVKSNSSGFTIEPLSLGGNRKYGGDDVTQKIVDTVLKEFEQRIQKAAGNISFSIPYLKQRKVLGVSGNPKYDEAVIYNSSTLYRVAEQMKRELSRRQETEGIFQLSVVVGEDVRSLEDLIDGAANIKFTVQQLQSLIEPALNETFADIDAMIIDNDDYLPDIIILAGQSSKMPLLKTLMATHIQKRYNKEIPINLAEYLKERVVIGAVQYAHSQQLPGTTFKINLVDKTHSRLGILKLSGTRTVFWEMIPKGRLIPDESSVTIDFPINAKGVSIVVREHFGRDNELTEASHIGEYTFDFTDEVSEKALEEARLKMSVEENGEISVVALVDNNEYEFTVEKKEPEFVNEI
jgi:molecular chaperone DnaK (HSP70)